MKFTNIRDIVEMLTSPRAESARAGTGRRCHHSGVGEDFLARRHFFYENGRTSDTKSRKIDPKVRLEESYKLSIDEIRGPIANNGFSGQNPNF